MPTLPSDKLSKIQTLKLASNYIDFLNKVSLFFTKLWCDGAFQSFSEKMRLLETNHNEYDI